MEKTFPWLRYVDADDLEGGDLDLSGLKVRDTAGEKLGTVDGFVVDAASGRPYYIVVDAGGWFKSKDFLLPIGHARLDADRDALVADVPKERIDGYPGFDTSQFEELSEDELRRMNDAICSASTVSATTYAPTAPLATAWERPDYRQPDWWKHRESSRLSTRETSRAVPDASAAAYRGEYPAQDREAVRARESDVSPHAGGRAQPGDVLGVETGGEETHIGDTSEDEDKRRQDAEKSARKSRE